MGEYHLLVHSSEAVGVLRGRAPPPGKKYEKTKLRQKKPNRLQSWEKVVRVPGCGLRLREGGAEVGLGGDSRRGQGHNGERVGFCKFGRFFLICQGLIFAGQQG